MAGSNKITPEETKAELKKAETRIGNIADANTKMAMIIKAENASLRIDFLSHLSDLHADEAKMLKQAQEQMVNISRNTNKYFEQFAGIASRKKGGG